MSRYARQSAVPSFGEDATKLLRAGSVLVIGAGGLAAPVLQYLVGAGVGRIRLVDADIVGLSNLHRQTLFRESDVGAPKVVAAARHLAALNSECQIEPLQTRFTPANTATLMQGVDIVLDCADSFAASYIASDQAMALGLPLISASVVGLSGYCGGFCGGAPSLRALFPDLPDQLGSCDADGVLGPAVGIIGSLQAQMAMAVLAQTSPNPLGQLVSYDASNLRFAQFRFDNAPEPDGGPAFIATEQITPKDYLIDLRAIDEPGPELPSAMRRTVAEIASQGVPDAPGGQRIVLACRSGLRAWRAAEHLKHIAPTEIALLALGDGSDI